MKKRSVMAVPNGCFFAVIAVCVIGIIVGSIWDYDINVALANKTELGSFFATYGLPRGGHRGDHRGHHHGPGRRRTAHRGGHLLRHRIFAGVSADLK